MFRSKNHFAACFLCTLMIFESTHHLNKKEKKKHKTLVAKMQCVQNCLSFCFVFAWLVVFCSVSFFVLFCFCFPLFLFCFVCFVCLFVCDFVFAFLFFVLCFVSLSFVLHPGTSKRWCYSYWKKVKIFYDFLLSLFINIFTSICLPPPP